jgi:hypothetical protein
MRHLLLCSLLLLAGCQNVVGPGQPRTVRVDDPLLPTSDQAWRGRAFLAKPDESYLSGPQTGIASGPNTSFDPGRK